MNQGKRKWIEYVLATSENDCDEDMIAYFRRWGMLTESEIEAIMSQREAALRDPVHFRLAI